jgi:hypothetical protein
MPGMQSTSSKWFAWSTTLGTPDGKERFQNGPAETLSASSQYLNSTLSPFRSFNAFLADDSVSFSSVAKAFRRSFQEQGSSSDPRLYSAGLEYIPIDVHVPVLDVQNIPELPEMRMLSNAVVQGFFDPGRRDYEMIFRVLAQHIHGRTLYYLSSICLIFLFSNTYRGS